ncbi:MAG: hypothetical protein GY801_07010 [bacterium]|nr:hypothetical protein [bacterium]
MKLWADTLKKLEQSTKELRQVRPQLEKYALRVHEEFCQPPLPLRRVHVLMTTNGQEFRLTPIEGMRKLPVLLNHTYRQRFINELG